MTEWKAPGGHHYSVHSPKSVVPKPKSVVPKRPEGKTLEDLVIEDLSHENAELRLELMQAQDVIAAYQKYFAERHHWIHELHRDIGYDSGLSYPQVDTVQIRDTLE